MQISNLKQNFTPHHHAQAPQMTILSHYAKATPPPNSQISFKIAKWAVLTFKNPLHSPLSDHFITNRTLFKIVLALSQTESPQHSRTPKPPLIKMYWCLKNAKHTAQRCINTKNNMI
ncbi:hypothetical protein [Campylobacter gastrosuis]|uniref:Uncharacterized protein n=1 Tax=Campylobacter gastrosuis TaxID=2974576 RepID=A0ABT7HSF8_9BACT|nr:hypothetical protein [Campylobacter gastrosuis]MDL0089861.1 hypothetical protein [Campylobacter gastrosuis]